MFITWVIFHVIVCIGLVLVVLLQSAKGEGLAGSAFGGGGGGLGGAVFGGRGAGSFLSKATTVLAILFMVNCVSLAFISSGNRINIGTSDETVTESAVTRQAQADRERALEQQRLQQEQQLADSTGQESPIQVTPIEINTTPVDSGK
ncbi:MAG: preprotein translocase subunit SecG [bacterium]